MNLKQFQKQTRNTDNNANIYFLSVAAQPHLCMSIDIKSEFPVNK